jgi:hypothetical protein
MVLRETSVETPSTYFIEKTIILPMEDFVNFVTDMTVERFFLKKNHLLCRIDNEGIWHCLLVKPQGHKEGILALADERRFPFALLYI